MASLMLLPTELRMFFLSFAIPTRVEIVMYSGAPTDFFGHSYRNPAVPVMLVNKQLHSELLEITPTAVTLKIMTFWSVSSLGVLRTHFLICPKNIKQCVVQVDIECRVRIPRGLGSPNDTRAIEKSTNDKMWRKLCMSSRWSSNTSSLERSRLDGPTVMRMSIW